MWQTRNNFEWQMWWSSWGLSCTDVPYEGYGVNLVKRYLILGPLQMCWYRIVK